MIVANFLTNGWVHGGLNFDVWAVNRFLLSSPRRWWGLDAAANHCSCREGLRGIFLSGGGCTLPMLWFIFVRAYRIGVRGRFFLWLVLWVI